jgi:hypothetical protein
VSSPLVCPPHVVTQLDAGRLELLVDLRDLLVFEPDSTSCPNSDSSRLLSPQRPRRARRSRERGCRRSQIHAAGRRAIGGFTDRGPCISAVPDASRPARSDTPDAQHATKGVTMSDLGEEIEEATALLAASDEAKALQILRDAVDATHDPGLLKEIHELATMDHESSRGFHRIEWHKLMIETEPQTTGAPST